MRRFRLLLIYVFCCGLMLTVFSCAKNKDTKGYFKIPQKVKIVKSEGIKSKCYDYAIAEVIRLLKKIDVSTIVSSEVNYTNVVNLQILLPESDRIESFIDTSEIFCDGFILQTTKEGTNITANNAKGVLNGI